MNTGKGPSGKAPLAALQGSAVRFRARAAPVVGAAGCLLLGQVLCLQGPPLLRRLTLPMTAPARRIVQPATHLQFQNTQVTCRSSWVNSWAGLMLCSEGLKAESDGEHFFSFTPLI